MSEPFDIDADERNEDWILSDERRAEEIKIMEDLMAQHGKGDQEEEEAEPEE